LTRYLFKYAPESIGSEIINRPKITVSLCSISNEWHFFRAYVDSGADVSLFTRDDCELLGLKLKEGNYKAIIGVGRTLIPAYMHAIKIRIGESELDVKVAFADSDEVPRLLGRTDIFTHFNITFAEQDLEIIFESRP
jgi:Aspartyl protease